MGGDGLEVGFWRGSSCTRCMGRPHWGQRMTLEVRFELGVSWLGARLGRGCSAAVVRSQQRLELLELLPLLRAEEAEVADLLEAVGQDML